MKFRDHIYRDPMTAGMAMMGGGGLLKAGGDIYSGNAQGAAADYNAQLANQNADLAVEQANEEARRSAILAAKQIGQGRAASGASGLAMDGSVLDVLRESAANAELESRSIRHKGQVAAYGYRSSAALDEVKGSVARTQGYLSAAGDLLGTGGKMAGSFA